MKTPRDRMRARMSRKCIYVTISKSMFLTNVRFEILSAVLLKIQVFIMLTYSTTENSPTFRRTVVTFKGG